MLNLKTNKPYQIVFDFDGTIADTLPLLMEIIKKVISNYGYNIEISVDKIRKNFKNIIRESGISLLKLPFIIKSINNELYTKIAHVKPVDGIINIIHELKRKNFSLGIISSNHLLNIEKFLEINKLENIFEYIYPEVNLFLKYKTIKDFLLKYNLNKDYVIYIADEVRDIESAKYSGVKIISVTWGLNDYETLAEYKPDFLAKEPYDILTYLDIIFKNN